MAYALSMNEWVDLMETNSSFDMIHRKSAVNERHLMLLSDSFTFITWPDWEAILSGMESEENDGGTSDWYKVYQREVAGL